MDRAYIETYRELAPHLAQVLRQPVFPRDVAHAREVVDALPLLDLGKALVDGRHIDPVPRVTPS